MKEEYLKAMAKSYSNQVGRLTVPANQLKGIVEIPLGFQPLGIASQGNRIAIAAYFEPAVCLVDVSRDEEGLHFDVNWIRGANHGIQSVRLFPDIWQPGGANRAQTVNFGPDDTLWVTRNGDREFFILSPPKEPKGRWTLSGAKTLPGEGMVHSALLSGGKLLTIESTSDLEAWFRREYKSDKFEVIDENPSAPYLYGLAEENSLVYAITDARCDLKHGIYKGSYLLAPEIWGNGICFIVEGALVTKYGQSATGPFNGEPGGLIFVPRRMLE